MWNGSEFNVIPVTFSFLSLSLLPSLNYIDPILTARFSFLMSYLNVLLNVSPFPI